MASKTVGSGEQFSQVDDTINQSISGSIGWCWYGGLECRAVRVGSTDVACLTVTRILNIPELFRFNQREILYHRLVSCRDGVSHNKTSTINSREDIVVPSPLVALGRWEHAEKSLISLKNILVSYSLSSLESLATRTNSIEVLCMQNLGLIIWVWVP